mgnify:CR=1 FL=1|tara:strand:- start:2627 stop:3385 length:759 start_codon:yes stop_codon:yes gene_type:complete
MAVQLKTLVNDVGSAVVDEMASQLNRAISVTPFQMLRQPIAAAGTGALDDITYGDNERSSGVLMVASEDLFVTSVKLCFTLTNGDASTPAQTTFVLLRVPATWQQFDGTSQTQIVQAVAVNGIHGNNAGALGGAGTYQVVFSTTGAAFSSANRFQAGEVGELVGLTATGGAAGILGANLVGTLVSATTCGNSNPVSCQDGFAMNAGDSLVWAYYNKTGADTQLMASVGYRPVKDQLSLTPSFTQKTFATRDR